MRRVLDPEEFDIKFITETVSVYQLNDDISLAFEKLTVLKEGKLEIDYDQGYMIRVVLYIDDYDNNVIKSYVLNRLKLTDIKEFSSMLDELITKLEDEDAILKLSHMKSNMVENDS